ncbi:MAG: tetratricopeptide repeat protein [Spirochaetia bacterium]|nr:tetratricopeptide repeat protein [Spirochaetia bacterium]
MQYKILVGLNTNEYVLSKFQSRLQMKKNYFLLILMIFLTIFTNSTHLFADENLIVNTDKNYEPLNAEAVDEINLGKHDPAISKFKNVVTLQDKNAAMLYNNLAYTYVLKGDYTNALEFFQKAVDRDPTLITAIANLGKMNYIQGNYQDAITYGEKTLTLDPQNKNVQEWLPDAYKKIADKKIFDLKNEQKQEPDNLTVKKPDSLLEINGIYELSITKLMLTPHHHAANNVFTLPAGLMTDIWASPEVEIVGEFKTPGPGLYIPYFITSEENISFNLHNKKFFYGMGIYFSQADFSYNRIDGHGVFIHNLTAAKSNDTKLGLSFGFKQEFSSFLFYTYPRYLFQDMLTGPQKIEYDRSLTKIEYRMTLPEDTKRPLIPLRIELGIGFKTNEFFITEYNTSPSNTTFGHYFGTYDLYLDFTFGKVQPVFDKTPMQFGFILVSRSYFQGFDETSSSNIFGFGQGFFGFDWRSIFLKAGPFPTYNQTSYLIEVYSRQMFLTQLVVMEKTGVELTGVNAPYNGFYLATSVAYTF